MTAEPPPVQLFSEILEELADRSDDRLTLAEMIEAFGDRALSAVMVLIGLISILPWPPGSKVVFSVPLIILGLETALQRQSPSLPGWILRRSVSRRSFSAGLAHLIRGVRALERLSRPRWPAATSPVMRSVIGLICVALAVMLALPIPFGDLLPAITIIVLAFGLMQRDGLVVGLGLLGATASGIYMALVWSAVTSLFVAVVRWVQGLEG
ncbi:MAG TPA: exopolysaccharide biosynthesis protein [Brevundimonas sp.]|uniref:exopolysaccharide biosynthesis protein n=1 Tax=Brevundimonas sp. TaxID=1871086 RepID=UPI002C32A759|nr:exopolysaccharide biosynthesis protein [Brevundimonas sp.]HRH19537.1 exopolysaccharide biosynthesis protein [Brevundimonas sp.]